MRLLSRLIGVAAVALLAGTIWGQTSGEIAGDVRDPSGSVITGADVKAVNKGTGAERSAMTNDAGLYNFPNLQPGVYDVTASKSGFQTMTRTDLTLQVQQTARVDFAMQIGQTTQTVEVTGASALLTTENATVGSVIENKRIVELPLNGRNFLQLVSLAPNVSSGFSDNAVAGARQGGSRAGQNISVAGSRSEFNHFTLDGVENTDPTYNTYVFLPSIDALQEFKVQTGVYSAEFGRAIAQVNVSTKSGTNAYHGALFEFLRNEKLDAKNYAFDQNRPARDPFKWNQFGFALGGPLSIPKIYDAKNRLFFFSNFEGYRDRKQLRGNFAVPTAAMRAGDFRGVGTIYDPATRVQTGNVVRALPFANNMIPVQRLDPIALKLLEFFPEQNVFGGTGFAGTRQDGLRRVIDKDQFTQRIDFVESTNSNWYGRYSWGSEVQSQEGIRLTGSKIATEPRQEMISNNRIFTPTLVNEFRVTHIGFSNTFATPLSGIRNVSSELGMGGIAPSDPAAWGIPNITINPFSQFGDSTNGPFVTNNHIFQFVDNMSWTKGRHALRFGAEIRRDRYNLRGNTDPRGTLVFNGQITEDPSAGRPPGSSAASGTPLADFLLGFPQRSSVAAALAFGQFRSTVQNYYIDDTWRIHPKVTINVGLRYENTAPYKDRSQRFSNMYVPFISPNGSVVNPDRSLHPTMVRLGSGDFNEGTSVRFNPNINTARDGRLGDRGVSRDNNDFAPRIGLAWSPTDKMTIRAGFGAFFVQEIAAIYFDVSRNLGGPREATTDNNFPGLTLKNPFLDANALVTVSNASLLGIETRRRTPYTFQYLLNVQRQITKDTVVEVGYLGTQAKKLQSWFPYNEPAVGPASSTPRSRFPFPELDPSWTMNGTGKSSYHSLAVKVERRLSQGLTSMVSYTWSKSIDLSSGARAHFGEQQFPQSGYCLECERGLSIFNVGHRFVTSNLYELPFGKGKRFLASNRVGNAVLGGWQLSTIITMQTGTPATVISGSDTSNRRTTIDRPNTNGQTVAIPRGEQDPNRFFNTGAFFKPGQPSLGNVGRNTIIGPGIINWDLSVIKNIALGETRQLQFRWEMFNLPNHPNWALGPTGANGSSNLAAGSSTNLSDALYGRIRATRTDMRDIQVGLKFIF